MENKDNKDLTLREDEKEGNISIADDVVATIASIAATEVPGVDSTTGNATDEFMSKVGIGKHGKGVKVTVSGGSVRIEMALTISYGYNIPETCQSVQGKVKSTVESTTGLEVSNVHVRVAGISMKEA
ncbi:MAG TPA: Asp23/Gls24 family envelope stress response protein [Lachnospiraceae bacterium]|nr:Asp23/Gls24 family envelope stress response protein [Lachnospiraceae bacterium]